MTLGIMEFDSAIMDHRRRYGAVMALQNIQKPVSVAKSILRTYVHVLFFLFFFPFMSLFFFPFMSLFSIIPFLFLSAFSCSYFLSILAQLSNCLFDEILTFLYIFTFLQRIVFITSCVGTER
jgi:Asparaginase